MSTPGPTMRPTVVTVERLVAGGDGFARLDDGRVAFVAGGLPGEQVEIDVVDDRGDFVRATVVEVLEPSADRRSAPCPHRVAGCGGCGWMELDEAAQATAKVDIVRESLRRTARLDAEDVDALVSFAGSVGPFGWRTTLRVVGTRDGIGFRRSGSHDVVAIDSCPVAHEHLQPVLREVSVSAGREALIRCSVATGDITVAPVDLAPRRRRRGRPAGPATSPTTIGGLDRVPGVGDGVGVGVGVGVGADQSVTETVDGTSLRVSNRSFFQSGAEAAEHLVAEVARAAPELADAGHVVDLYGGVGLFAATVARSARHVTVVESSPSACDDARFNLADRSATVVRADVGEWRPPDPPAEPDPHLDHDHDQNAAAIDVVIADPARPGLAKPGVRTVASIGAPVVVLVSCDPVSGARDLALLAVHGYRCESIRVLDLFPQTHHVEMVARYVRVAADRSP